MAFSPDRRLQVHLDRWIHLLGLRKWRITWELVDEPMDYDDSAAWNHYYVRRAGRHEAHIKFSRAYVTSDQRAERLAVHELLHLLDWGLGNDAHRLIERLESKMRLVRRRASGRK